MRTVRSQVVVLSLAAVAAATGGPGCQSVVCNPGFQMASGQCLPISPPDGGPGPVTDALVDLGDMALPDVASDPLPDVGADRPDLAQDSPDLVPPDMPPGPDVPGGQDAITPVDQITEDLAGQDTVEQDVAGQDQTGMDLPGMDAPRVDMIADGGGGTDAITVTVAPIQDVQDGTVAKGTLVTLVKKIVTGVRVASAGNVNLYVQEPEGQTPAGHTYPEFAGVNVFFNNAEAPTFPTLSGVAVGDCISVTGTVDEFPENAVIDAGTTQIATPTAFTRETGCGTAPAPFAATFADIAVNNNLAGPKAETYEGVVVVLSNVAVTGGGAVSSNRFNVSPGGAAGATLEIDSFLIGGNFTFPASTSFSSITGVYSQLNRGTGMTTVVYRITPRTIGELVVQ